MNDKTIEDIIKKSINNFNLVSSKNLQIKNVRKFIFNKKFDSLATINLVMAFEEVIQNKEIINDMRKKPLNKVFKNYVSIKKFLKKYEY
jgi:acyl carrier protein